MSFGNDLSKVNGNSSWELPLSATYVISSNNKIIFAFVNPDYKKRAEPKDIITALEKESKALTKSEN